MSLVNQLMSGAAAMLLASTAFAVEPPTWAETHQRASSTLTLWSSSASLLNTPSIELVSRNWYRTDFDFNLVPGADENFTIGLIVNGHSDEWNVDKVNGFRVFWSLVPPVVPEGSTLAQAPSATVAATSTWQGNSFAGSFWAGANSGDFSFAVSDILGGSLLTAEGTSSPLNGVLRVSIMTTVPEPGTLGLVVAGLAVAALAVQRKTPQPAR